MLICVVTGRVRVWKLRHNSVVNRMFWKWHDVKIIFCIILWHMSLPTFLASSSYRAILQAVLDVSLMLPFKKRFLKTTELMKLCTLLSLYIDIKYYSFGIAVIVCVPRSDGGKLRSVFVISKGFLQQINFLGIKLSFSASNKVPLHQTKILIC